MLALGAWAGVAWLRRRRLPEGRAFLWATALCGPLSVLALEAGWVVTEVGRQPWIVQGHMRTADAVTTVPGVGWMLAASIFIYGVLTAGTLVILRILARRPLEDAHGA